MHWFVLLPVVLCSQVPQSLEEQVAELRRIAQRTAMARTGSMLPQRDFLNRRRHVEEEATQLLETKGGWWAEFKEVQHPAVMFNGFAWRGAATLSSAWATPQSRYFHSEQVLRSIESGLTHLLTFAYPDCPRPGNWWAWEIGMPMNLLDTLTLAGDALPPALRQREIDTLAYLLKVRDDLKLSGPAVLPLKDVPGKTDMNALWHARLCLQLAVLARNPAMAARWAQATMSEIGIPGEGSLQADYSYKFHGANPMWAYGRGILIDYANLLDVYRGTAFGPSDAQIDRFAQCAMHYAEGFLYRGSICPAITGREITRGEAVYHDDFGPPAIRALGALVRAGHPQSRAMASIIARDRRFFTSPQVSAAVDEAAAGVPLLEPAPPIDDIFAWPDSDFLQVTRPGWAIGIKMCSKRNHGYESINGENLQGWFLSHGSMFPLITGQEWRGCWPTLDWTHLPGTTAAGEIHDRNTSPIAGVLRASPRQALAALELSCGAMHARKSWFIDGDCIVCVGSDISGPGAVDTTLFNQPAGSAGVLLVDGQEMSGEPFEMDVEADWLWTGNVGYVFPARQKIHVACREKTADWTTVREAARHGAGELRRGVYLLGILSHNATQNGYAYMMLPGATSDRMPEFSRQLREQYRIERDPAHRVVRTDGAADVGVLWAAGKFGELAADGPCLVLRSASQTLAADPGWRAEPVTVKRGDRTSKLPPRGRPTTLPG